MDWVDGVLVPHLQQKAAGIPVLMFLDQFSGHETDGYRNRMVELGVTLRSIPGGCTCLLQPIDVGIGKPFKDRVRAKWFDWMLPQVEQDINPPPPSRQLIQEWVHQSWDDISKGIVRNTWRKTGMNWF